MQKLSRREALRGTGVAALAAGAAMVPFVVCTENPVDKVARLTNELKAAMRDAYGSTNIREVSWGPHNPADLGDGMGSACVTIVAHYPKVRS